MVIFVFFFVAGRVIQCSDFQRDPYVVLAPSSTRIRHSLSLLIFPTRKMSSDFLPLSAQCYVQAQTKNHLRIYVDRINFVPETSLEL